MRAEQPRFRRLMDDESGSMVIALLATIVAAGLMLAVTSYAFASHRHLRFDRSRNVVIQTADSGINEVLFRLQAGQPVPTGSWSTPEAMAGGTFRWRADPWPSAGSTDFLIRSEGTVSQGTPAPVTRRVQAVLMRPTPFDYGVFADNRITLNGANSVDSYNDTTWNAGNGIIGSNGTIRFNGNSTANGVALYDYLANPTDRCLPLDSSKCQHTPPTNTREEIPEPLDLTSPESLAFIATGLQTCTTDLGVWTGTPLTGGTYCADRIEIPPNAVVAINSTPSNPTIIYLRGSTASNVPTVSIHRRARINCPSLSGSPALCTPREASKLQVFTASAFDVRIGNHSHVVGAIYAPRASCRGNPSNAQAHVYGSLVCRTVTNQGGWNFHYDQRLGDVGIGIHQVTRWSEG